MSINRVALYHLETLLWIDRLGTFSAAAERLKREAMRSAAETIIGTFESSYA